ncbi:MAG: hypothetical protein NUV65_02145 [Candidatus Roizmanbacteria bacterium]|nr:hypothetical protein [Candidatus Roizmanbacteria bacterium]
MVQRSSAWLGIVKHKRYVALFIALFIAFFMLFDVHFPDYLAYLKTPPGFMYMGKAAYFDPWDINVYVTAIRSGQQGHLLLQNFYTVDATRGALLYPIYTFVGYSFPHVDPFVLFHVVSTVAGFFLCMAIYWLIGYFIQSYKVRLLAFFLILFGGGMGWIVSGAFGSADMFVTSFTFHSSIQRGHEAIGTMLYLTSLVSLFVSLTTNRKRIFLFALSSFFLMIFYPYYLLSIGIIGFIFILLQKKDKISVALFLFGYAILGVVDIYYYLSLKNAGFASVATQQLSQVTIVHIIFGYGILGVLYILQLFSKKALRDSRYIFLNLWVLTSIALNFAPLGINRFFLRGLFFPIVVSVLIFIYSQKKTWGMSRTIVTIFLLFLVPLSTLSVYQRRVDEIPEENVWYYQPNTTRDMYAFLSKKTPANVLAAYVTSSHIPPFTGSKVYFGHIIQTPQFYEKFILVSSFYSGSETKAKAFEFLKNNNIEYVVYGSDEKKLGTLPHYSFLHSVFSNRDVTVYRVATP